MIHFFIALWNTHTNTPQITINTLTKKNPNCPIFWHLQRQQPNQGARWEIFTISKHLWSHVGVQWHDKDNDAIRGADILQYCSKQQLWWKSFSGEPVCCNVIALPSICLQPPSRPMNILTVLSSSSHLSPHPLGSSQVCDIIKHMLFEAAVMTAVPIPPPTQ